MERSIKQHINTTMMRDWTDSVQKKGGENEVLSVPPKTSPVDGAYRHDGTKVVYLVKPGPRAGLLHLVSHFISGFPQWFGSSFRISQGEM